MIRLISALVKLIVGVDCYELYPHWVISFSLPLPGRCSIVNTTTGDTTLVMSSADFWDL